MRRFTGTLLAFALILALAADSAFARGGARGGSPGMRARGGASQQAFGGYAGYKQQQLQQYQQRLQVQLRLQQQYRMRAGSGFGQQSYSGVSSGTTTYGMQRGGGAGQCPMGNAGGLQQGAQHRYGASQGGGVRQRIRTPDAAAP